MAIDLVSPLDSSTNVSVNPTFEWTAEGMFDHFRLEMAFDVDFNNMINLPDVQIPSFESSYSPEGTYRFIVPIYWRITGWGEGYENSNVFSYMSEQANIPNPSISPNGGSFSSSQLVTINSDPNSTSYYTLDGAEPTTSSSQYTVPFNITETTIVKVKAFPTEAQVYHPSEIVTASFTKEEIISSTSTTSSTTSSTTTTISTTTVSTTTVEQGEYTLEEFVQHVRSGDPVKVIVDSGKVVDLEIDGVNVKIDGDYDLGMFHTSRQVLGSASVKVHLMNGSLGAMAGITRLSKEPIKR